jgi:hypothetical protein
MRLLRCAAVLALSSFGTTAPAGAQFLALTQWSQGPGANGHWYAITEDATDFLAAKTFAEALGGYLVSVTSPLENQWISDTFSGYGTCSPGWCTPASFYLGLERSEGGGAFGWLSGEAFAFAAWSGGEPGDQGGGRAASLFQRDGRVLWDAASESNPMRAVIEWSDLPADFTAAPEPANVGLVAVGLTVLAIFGRIRRWRRIQRPHH